MEQRFERRSILETGLAVSLTIGIPLIGNYFLGPLVAAVFLAGYGGGLALWLWSPVRANYDTIRLPFWCVFTVFILLHKWEERKTNFIEVLGHTITGITTPAMSPALVVGLLILPLGAWLLVPLLMRRNVAFGRFLAWTFFASMGISELAHFMFPLLWEAPYGYFPGMASVPVLAPLAWWGMWRMWGKGAR